VKSRILRLSLPLLLALIPFGLMGCDDEAAFSCDNDSAICLTDAAVAMQNATCTCAVDLDPDLSTIDECVDVYFSGGLLPGAEACLRSLMDESELAAEAVDCAATAVGNAAVCAQGSECNLIQAGNCILNIASDLEACGISSDLLDAINGCTGDIGL
jgi:hypothetical protein